MREQPRPSDRAAERPPRLLDGVPAGVWACGEDRLDGAHESLRGKPGPARPGVFVESLDGKGIDADSDSFLLPPTMLRHGVPIVLDTAQPGTTRGLFSSAGGLGALVVQGARETRAYGIRRRSGGNLWCEALDSFRAKAQVDPVPEFGPEPSGRDDEAEPRTGCDWLVVRPTSDLDLLVRGPLVHALDRRSRPLLDWARSRAPRCAIMREVRDPWEALRLACVRARIVAALARGAPWRIALSETPAFSGILPEDMEATARRLATLEVSLDEAGEALINGRVAPLRRVSRGIRAAIGEQTPAERADALCLQLPSPLAVALRRAARDVGARRESAIDVTLRAWETVLTWTWAFLRARLGASLDVAQDDDREDLESWPGDERGFREFATLAEHAARLASRLCDDKEAAAVKALCGGSRRGGGAEEIRNEYAHSLSFLRRFDDAERLLAELVDRLEEWDELTLWSVAVAQEGDGISPSGGRCLRELSGDGVEPALRWVTLAPESEREPLAWQTPYALRNSGEKSPVVPLRLSPWVALQAADGSLDLLLPFRARPAERESAAASRPDRFESVVTGRVLATDATGEDVARLPGDAAPGGSPRLDLLVERLVGELDTEPSCHHPCAAVLRDALQRKGLPPIRARALLLAWEALERWRAGTVSAWEVSSNEPFPLARVAGIKTTADGRPTPPPEASPWLALRRARNDYFHRLKCPVTTDGDLAQLVSHFAAAQPLLQQLFTIRYGPFDENPTQPAAAFLRVPGHPRRSVFPLALYGNGEVWWPDARGRGALPYVNLRGAKRSFRDLVRDRFEAQPGDVEEHTRILENGVRSSLEASRRPVGDR